MTHDHNYINWLLAIRTSLLRFASNDPRHYPLKTSESHLTIVFQSLSLLNKHK
jgi:hypothetical protein